MEAINFGESLVSLTFSYEYSRRRDLCSEISGFLVRLMYGILGNEINNLFETPSGYTSNYKLYTLIIVRRYINENLGFKQTFPKNKRFARSKKKNKILIIILR